ncbi:MAG: 30S ribosomal protein S2 [Candidatus Aenigmatarchaeota archaeon]
MYEEYLSAGMHIGVKQQTKDMKRFIYKIRDDGLAILDLQTIEKRIQIAGKFLAKFNRIIVVSRKVIGWKPVKKFAEVINAKAFTGRFLPGTITNPSFPGYHEPDVLIVTDPLADSQAIKEAVKMRIPIVALATTTNQVTSIDLIIPVNNRGRKSVAMVYYLLAKEILKNRGEDKELKPEDFQMKEK